MSDVIINNYSDDAAIKSYVTNYLAPRVFHDIPLNILNTGQFSIMNEYLSQTIEQQSFTASFFFNEAFITKAVLADSIYAEAAKFNIGYSFATPSSCNFLFELKLEDIYNNATLNANTGLYEFIIDKDTKFNLDNGNVYSLDYDILVQYKNIETSSREAAIPAWNIQYTNIDSNIVAKNKNVYIMYRVTDTWLCLFIQASEYNREKHVVVNNMTNGIPNEDSVITCNNHICGFDIKYVDGSGNSKFIARDHILPIHNDITDSDPYIHYIMDNPQTIRFIFQLNGNKYFVPSLNSTYEITIYTCHGEAANFAAFKKDAQPQVITASTKYPNNANVMKAAFVVSGSMGGTNIGTTETIRRETIEAENTVNVISTDHDIQEWFKTFFFKNILYPFFFKRRDDPWCRVWSGYLALKDTDDYIFRTNTLHGKINYNVLYNNNDNTVSSNEIIIPPGLVWVYGDENRYTLVPYTMGNGVTVETAKTLAKMNEKFVFSNPFGIRIQKDPFAIGYFNPWIDQFVTTTRLTNIVSNQAVDNNTEDVTYIYHAFPIITNITRTYKNNYYNISTYITPTVSAWVDGSELIRYISQNAIAPQFVSIMWNYFKEPLDLYTANIPILPLLQSDGYIPFDPDKTFFCVRSRNRVNSNAWSLSDIWIDDMSTSESKRVFIPITGDITMLYGTNEIWGDNGVWKGHEVYVSGDTDIGLYPTLADESPIKFERITSQNYYEMKLSDNVQTGVISKIIVGEAIQTTLTKYGESVLTKIGKSYAAETYINIYFANGLVTQYTITNSANIYIPYDCSVDEYGNFVFDFDNIGPASVILYADMRSSPDDGAIDYYRIPFNELPENKAMFYISNQLLPMELNNMRVVLHALMNGTEVGYVEMQPVTKESDGSYRFEVNTYPLNQLVDIDNRINIASIENGGGSWISTTSGSVVSIDASEPEFKISIFVRSEDSSRDSDIEIGDSFTGFRLIDEYMLDDVTLIQELKEMRSVVNFGENSIPTEQQLLLYNNMISLNEYNSTQNNMWTLIDYSYKKMDGLTTNLISFTEVKNTADNLTTLLTTYINSYSSIISTNVTSFDIIKNTLTTISASSNGTNIDWEDTWEKLSLYKDIINQAFDKVNVNGGVEIQLMPFVESSLMNSDRFESFVSAFTQVHKAIEPVIFNRLEGNNYLDCKLIATYGLPHSYSSDNDADRDNVFWPDLNVQIEFDVKLFNSALTSNTINELRLIVKSYFNRLTSIHTPVDMISMDNNIYISHLIQQMEAHTNVAYMKFKGWYTNEKNTINGNYMDANIQAIVQKWKKLEDFPKNELTRFVPELFVLEDKNIVLNIL